mmetsp:Transcript_1122/g.2738  ORF Transcript_1122/g.2738 Transcript_1122/m.2738 type:complete len:203 (+) Transcript_1122:148-756(+)
MLLCPSALRTPATWEFTALTCDVPGIASRQPQTNCAESRVPRRTASDSPAWTATRTHAVHSPDGDLKQSHTVHEMPLSPAHSSVREAHKPHTRCVHRSVESEFLQMPNIQRLRPQHRLPPRVRPALLALRRGLYWSEALPAVAPLALALPRSRCWGLGVVPTTALACACRALLNGGINQHVHPELAHRERPSRHGWDLDANH